MRSAYAAFFPDIEMVDPVSDFRFIHYLSDIISKNNNRHNPPWFVDGFWILGIRVLYTTFMLIFQYEH